MYKENEDGTRSFSTRFWVYTVIATLIIIFIGWHTQDTANKVEATAQATAAYAEANNKCINDLLAILQDRTGNNAKLRDIEDRRQTRFDQFIADVGSISTDQPQAARDAEAAPIIKQYFDDVAALNKEKATVLQAIADNPYPEPNCGQQQRGQTPGK